MEREKKQTAAKRAHDFEHAGRNRRRTGEQHKEPIALVTAFAMNAAVSFKAFTVQRTGENPNCFQQLIFFHAENRSQVVYNQSPVTDARQHIHVGKFFAFHIAGMADETCWREIVGRVGQVRHVKEIQRNRLAA